MLIHNLVVSLVKNGFIKYAHSSIRPYEYILTDHGKKNSVEFLGLYKKCRDDDIRLLGAEKAQYNSKSPKGSAFHAKYLKEKAKEIQMEVDTTMHPPSGNLAVSRAQSKSQCSIM